ncbi:hypothetical protein ONZ51_g11064 [Trametes cubensis]|uniref:Uncharacterized protein n=1 Tax=Trametes cubensis TaxID=1111947 RepID=A0AAD7TIN0_9APHY|nr:hypothetical protein ONZ51_g11064 [Trametes cubensis]
MSNDGLAAEQQAPSPSEAQRIRDKCTKAVEDYKNGIISKAQAVFIVASELVAQWEEETILEQRVKEQQEAQSHLHPHILHTLELLRNYGEDIAQAKRAISNSPSAPEFPDSEWTSVLSGRAIDLDHVFTGRYTPGPEEPVTEAISGIEFSINHPVAAKRITTCGDWVFAWGRATRATVFAFPHRRDELVAYGEYIEGLSRALAPAVHARVLNFDHTDDPSAAHLPGKRRLVVAGTLEHVRARPASVASNMSVSTVMETVTERPIATGTLHLWSDVAAQPRFLRGFVWGNSMRAVKCFTDVSLTHVPVPAVPQAVLEDSVVNATLQEHSELFTITTPIHVDRFEALQEDHPNHDFAASVVRALREGLWPYADAKPTTYPDTWDERRPSLMDEASMVFLLEQRNEEVMLGRYLACFGPDLLPGMYSMPVHIVPKPHSSKLCLVNDLGGEGHTWQIRLMRYL